MAPPDEHRPVQSAFHYHFHSQAARHMLAFHRRFYAV
jgi:hypothetical protein